jgi:hypothetical protein
VAVGEGAHVFVDESVRKTYLICAVLVDPADLDVARRKLRELCKPGQRRLHMAKEQLPRRRKILTAVTSLHLGARVFGCDGRPIDARRHCLQALVADLVHLDAARLVIERLETQERADRKWIHDTLAGLGAQLNYLHQPAYDEPLLWAADAVAWAYGAGNDWRRRVEKVVDRAVMLDG